MGWSGQWHHKMAALGLVSNKQTWIPAIKLNGTNNGGSLRPSFWLVHGQAVVVCPHARTRTGVLPFSTSGWLREGDPWGSFACLRLWAVPTSFQGGRRWSTGVWPLEMVSCGWDWFTSSSVPDPHHFMIRYENWYLYTQCESKYFDHKNELCDKGMPVCSGSDKIVSTDYVLGSRRKLHRTEGTTIICWKFNRFLHCH